MISDRGEIIDDYVYEMQLWTKRISSQSASPLDLYTLQPEPISSLFADQVNFRVTGFDEPYNPIGLKVETELTAEWNSQTIDYINRMEERGLPYKLLARSGGPYQTRIANKKIANTFKHRHTLINDATQIWKSAYWKDVGSVVLDTLFEKYYTKSMENLDALNSDPDLVVIGKPPSTGTGWRHPWNTKHSLAKNFHSGEAQFRNVIAQYYTDLRVIAQQWPFSGGRFSVSSPFTGTKGKRSDVDVLTWNGNRQHISSQTRDVGTVPDSTFHNATLDGQWRNEMWNNFKSNYHALPNDGKAFGEIVTTPLATIPDEDDEAYAFISADAGFHNGHLEYLRNRLNIGTSEISFGADQVVLSGIVMKTTHDNYNHHFMVSGSPFTMIQYLVTFGSLLADWAQRNDVTPAEMSVLQVGDDLQIRIKRVYIPSLLAELGPWLKCKGMKVEGPWHIAFVLGHYFCWNTDTEKMSMVMSPRGIKTVTTSAVLDKYDVPPKVDVGKEYILRPTSQALASSQEFWQEHSDYIYQLDQDPDDLKLWLEDEYMSTRELARKDLDIGEWIDELP